MPSPAEWDRDPVTTFKQFLHSPAFLQTSRRATKFLSDDSAEVYSFMFGRFAKWMAEHGHRMTRLRAADLIDFVRAPGHRAKPLDSKITYRYLRLLERCYEPLELAANPASEAIARLAADRPAHDRDMVALSPAQIARVSLRPVDPGAPVSWKRQRDRAMQLVMMHAGLRVAEAIGLLIDEAAAAPEEDGTLRITLTPAAKQPTIRTREVFLQAEAVAEVLAWFAARRKLDIPGALAFPADDSGRPLHKSTVYRQTRSALVAAGFHPSHAGGRTLRNGFAVAELNAGVPEAEMRERLGLVRPAALDAYIDAARRQREEEGDAKVPAPPAAPGRSGKG